MCDKRKTEQISTSSLLPSVELMPFRFENECSLLEARNRKKGRKEENNCFQVAVPDEFQASHSVSLLFAAGNLSLSFFFSVWTPTLYPIRETAMAAAATQGKHLSLFFLHLPPLSLSRFLSSIVVLPHQHAHHVRIRSCLYSSRGLGCLFPTFRTDKCLILVLPEFGQWIHRALISCQPETNKLFSCLARRFPFFLDGELASSSICQSVKHQIVRSI